MPDARTRRTRVAPGASSAHFNWPLVQARCKELGAETNIEAAILMGMAPRTLDRLRFKADGGVRLDTILHACEVTGLTLDDMFPLARSVA